MVILDTSAIVALDNTRQPNHEQAKLKAGAESAYLVPSFLMSEIAYMLDTSSSHGATARFLSSVEQGDVLVDFEPSSIGRIRELVTRYEDLPLGFADACVIECAERLGAKILTFDRHFQVVAREGTFELL